MHSVQVGHSGLENGGPLAKCEYSITAGLWQVKLDTGAILRHSWVTTTPTSPGGTLCYRLLSISLFNWSSSLHR